MSPGIITSDANLVGGALGSAAGGAVWRGAAGGVARVYSTMKGVK